MKKVLTFLFSLVCALSVQGKTLDEIRIRDPFIYADSLSGNYYMYCSMSRGKTGGVGVYKSQDLVNWDGPEQIFLIPSDNWATGKVWAPELHFYRDRFYLFMTITSDKEWRREVEGWPKFYFRGTQIFVSDNPTGPFESLSKCPQTPLTEMALDGTLWVENGEPYMIYCQEWVQCESGYIKYLKLTDDLSEPIGTAGYMFSASSAPWNYGAEHGEGLPVSHVTDAPCLMRGSGGELFMLWSGFSRRGYAVGLSISRNGSLGGPWEHQRLPVYNNDGGHASLFKDFQGRTRVVLHTPNNPGGAERAKIFYLEDCGKTIKFAE